MNIYDRRGNATDKMKILLLGNCLGIGLSRRGPKDSHIIVSLLVEDDEQWFECGSFSSFWLEDLDDVLAKAKKWLHQNAYKDKTGGYKFSR